MGYILKSKDNMGELLSSATISENILRTLTYFVIFLLSIIRQQILFYPFVDIIYPLVYMLHKSSHIWKGMIKFYSQ